MLFKTSKLNSEDCYNRVSSQMVWSIWSMGTDTGNKHDTYEYSDTRKSKNKKDMYPWVSKEYRYPTGIRLPSRSICASYAGAVALRLKRKSNTISMDRS